MRANAIDRQPRRSQNLTILEERKGNRISLRAAARIVRVQMVSAIVARQQLLWMAGVPQNSVKIHHVIEFAAIEDPLVDFLPDAFFFDIEESDRRRRGHPIPETHFRKVGLLLR